MSCSCKWRRKVERRPWVKGSTRWDRKRGRGFRRLSLATVQTSLDDGPRAMLIRRTTLVPIHWTAATSASSPCRPTSDPDRSPRRIPCGSFVHSRVVLRRRISSFVSRTVLHRVTLIVSCFHLAGQRVSRSKMSLRPRHNFS